MRHLQVGMHACCPSCIRRQYIRLQSASDLTGLIPPIHTHHQGQLCLTVHGLNPSALISAPRPLTAGPQLNATPDGPPHVQPQSLQSPHFSISATTTRVRVLRQPRKGFPPPRDIRIDRSRHVEKVRRPTRLLRCVVPRRRWTLFERCCCLVAPHDL